MAPTAKVDQRRPGMLPADFGEWDSKESPDTLPEGFDGFDAASSTLGNKSSSTPPAKVQASGRTLVDRVEKPRPSRQSTGHASAISIPAPADKPETLKPSNRAAARASAAALVREEEADRKNLRIEDEGKDKKKKVLIATGSVLLLLTATPLIYFNLRPKTVPQKNAVSIAVQPQAQQISEKPSPSTPISPVAVPAQSAPVDPAPAPRVKTDMMDNQLSAPSRISRDLRSAGDQQAPGLSAPIEGMGGNGGETVSSVFGAKRGVVVKADTRSVNISAGVATGLLVQKTTPVYPAIARSSQVAGTVVLKATISKSGTIDDLHVVSGPAMLRRAALDAVKTWRYRPYLLNNQPVEVDTTVDVIFSLGR